MITDVEKSTNRSLTQEQLDYFWKNGYLKIGKIFSDDEIALLGSEYLHEMEKGFQANNVSNLSVKPDADIKTKRNASQQVFQIVNLCERNIHFRKLLYDKRILDIVEALIGPNIMLFHDQALYKPAHTGGAVFWHQDNGYWRCRPANLVSCWMTFDPVIRESGAMQVIPGSHLTPQWHNAKSKDSILLEINDIDKTNVQIMDLPAGGIMFHHCQTQHYTDPNTTDIQRRAFAIHYMQPGTWSDHLQQYLSVDFAHPMLRARV